MIWRDTWRDGPGVVVISEGGVQAGQLHAVVLALRLSQRPTMPVTLTNEHGERACIRLPAELDSFSLTPRIALTVEVTT